MIAVTSQEEEEEGPIGLKGLSELAHVLKRIHLSETGQKTGLWYKACPVQRYQLADFVVVIVSAGYRPGPAWASASSRPCPCPACWRRWRRSWRRPRSSTSSTTPWPTRTRRWTAPLDNLSLHPVSSARESLADGGWVGWGGFFRSAVVQGLCCLCILEKNELPFWKSWEFVNNDHGLRFFCFNYLFASFASEKNNMVARSPSPETREWVKQ